MDDQAPNESTSRRGWLRMVGAGAAGAVGATLASATPAFAAGSTFFPISPPYRSLDTRVGTPLQQDDEVDIDLVTDVFGNPRIPSTALAVTYNLTVTQTFLNGFLSMYPANVSFPGTSSINWWGSGFNLANGGTVTLGPSPFSGAGSVTILCAGANGCQTHLLIDITGYYLPA